MLKRIVFKYRAWRLLSKSKDTNADTFEDFLVEYCRLYNNYEPKTFKYSVLKDREIETRYLTVNKLINECLMPIVKDLHINKRIDGDLTNKSTKLVNAMEFFDMSNKNIKTPEELLTYFNENLNRLLDVYHSHKKYCVHNNLTSILSSNTRKLLPLVSMAREIILITLLTEGEDNESIRKYIVW